MLVWVDVLLDVLLEVREPVFPELVFPGLAPAACAPADVIVKTTIAAAGALIAERFNTRASVYAFEAPMVLDRVVYLMTWLAPRHFSFRSR
ncbi:hypothetical protein MPC4_140079 [Methylocella tundrae]|uniref:Uncharacterized protein n=1 Tax=Methylocella tundrae TaxID=227605 RepID=A0A8B6M4E6_METTU|nr:hypothetical protein MPC1_1080001 [Methylocella tundrae]VTZ49180.1 hypothetical protein MPC4_140079 [Methylocella tundrae]